MTATNMCYNFVGFRYTPPLSLIILAMLVISKHEPSICTQKSKVPSHPGTFMQATNIYTIGVNIWIDLTKEHRIMTLHLHPNSLLTLYYHITNHCTDY